MRWDLLCFSQIIYPTVVKHHGMNPKTSSLDFIYTWFRGSFQECGTSLCVFAGELFQLHLLFRQKSMNASHSWGKMITAWRKNLSLRTRIISMRCTQTEGCWCSTCGCEIFSTGFYLVVVLITCSGKTAKREKKNLCQFSLGKFPFSSNSKNLMLLSKHSILLCSGKG